MTSSENTTLRDVGFDARHHELYRALTDSEGPFKTMKDVFMLAACIGYEDGRATELDNRTANIPVSTFTEQIDWPIIRAIGIASTKDISILGSQPDLLSLIERYANHGIEIINTRLGNIHGNKTIALVEFLLGGQDKQFFEI